MLPGKTSESGWVEGGRKGVRESGEEVVSNQARFRGWFGGALVGLLTSLSFFILSSP